MMDIIDGSGLWSITAGAAIASTGQSILSSFNPSIMGCFILFILLIGV